MKSVFFAIIFLFLVGTALTADEDHTCNLECSNNSGNYSGDTSIVLQIGGSSQTDILFDVDYKIFGVINFKYNLAFLTNGKFLVIINIKTGVYILLDIKTLYAVYGTISVNICPTSTQEDLSDFTAAINALLVQYPTITSDTPGSFDFNLLITAFFNNQFDLSSIYSSPELVNVLEENFGDWFKLIENAINDGSVLPSSGFWGFLYLIIGTDIQTASYIVEIIRVLTTVYEEMDEEVIADLINIIQNDIGSVGKFSKKLSAIISVVGKVVVNVLLNYVNNPKYDPVTYEVTVGSNTYSIEVYQINSSFVIRITFVASGNDVDFEIIYSNNVLFIANLRTNIVIAMQGTSIIVANRTSLIVASTEIVDVVFVVRFHNILSSMTTISVVNDTNYVTLLKQESWHEAAVEAKTLIKQNKSSGRKVNLQTLVKAVDANDESKVGSLIGSTTLAPYFIGSFSEFFSQMGYGNITMASFILCLFGEELKNNPFIKTLVRVITSVASSGSSFGDFLPSLFKSLRSNPNIGLSASGSVST